MSSKCITHGCPNHKNQGSFIGDMCAPCSNMLISGDPKFGVTFVHKMRDRIEELEKQNASLEAKLDSLVPALSYEGLRTDEAEAKLAIAMVGLVQSRDELDLYSQNEYPSDHPVHERYRKRDYDANPARIAIAKIKGEQL